MKLLAVVGRCNDLVAVLRLMQLMGASRLHIAAVVLFKRSHHFRTKQGAACLTREEGGKRLFTLYAEGEGTAQLVHDALTASTAKNAFWDVRMVTL